MTTDDADTDTWQDFAFSVLSSRESASYLGFDSGGFGGINGMNIVLVTGMNIANILEKSVQYDSVLGGQSSAVPLEMPLDISPLYAPDAEIMDLWTGSWLDPSTADFS